MKKVLYITIAILFTVSLKAQENRLAEIYFNDGEYEKAASMYRSLFDKNKTLTYYFQKYTECLIALKRYEEAEISVKNEIKSNPLEPQYLVTLSNIYEKSNQLEKAEKSQNDILVLLKKKPELTDLVARTFISMNMYDLAVKAYISAAESMNNPKLYSFNIADLYRRLGQSDNMIKYYLLSIEQFQGNMNYLIQTFERSLDADDIVKLQTQLYARIQEQPSQLLYNELLEWTFINQKDYKKAMRQARSMDRNLNENGARVFNIGNIAYNDKDYDTAVECYSYIVDTKSINSSYYLEAKRSLLNARRNKITAGFNYTKTDLLSLQNEYDAFLTDYGRNTQTAQFMVEYADFEALYMNDLQKAKAILEQVISFGGVPPTITADAKLKLGDYHLMEEDQWEATLLYSQVDKSFKEGVLGEQARYRNAKLSYYLGDFEWAQDQFDILKSATTRLISNDAIDLSVFIMDNLNLDTTATPLQLFSKAELLIFQNKLDEAMATLDSIAKTYPEHSLLDDILYVSAQIYKKKLMTKEAVECYNIILAKYPTEIRADNALFDLAWMNENQFKDLEKAKELYLKLFTEYTASTFAIDARKRYRLLRGDNL